MRQYSSEYFSFNRWGRWKDILSHGKFKKMLEEKDVENISRALVITVLFVESFVLLFKNWDLKEIFLSEITCNFFFQLIYSLQQYKGDEKIKEFIWDLISPSSDGSLKNHSGRSPGQDDKVHAKRITINLLIFICNLNFWNLYRLTCAFYM